MQNIIKEMLKEPGEARCGKYFNCNERFCYGGARRPIVGIFNSKPQTSKQNEGK